MGPGKQRRITLSLGLTAFAEIQAIATYEGRYVAEVARLLLKSGLRSYRRGRPLLCGYPNCTRKNCCGEERANGQLLMFPSRSESEH